LKNRSFADARSVVVDRHDVEFDITLSFGILINTAVSVDDIERNETVEVGEGKVAKVKTELHP
jgi:hypothetical protein